MQNMSLHHPCSCRSETCKRRHRDSVERSHRYLRCVSWSLEDALSIQHNLLASCMVVLRGWHCKGMGSNKLSMAIQFDKEPSVLVVLSEFLRGNNNLESGTDQVKKQN